MSCFTHAFRARRWLRAAALAGSGAALVAASLGGPAQAATETRSVADFDQVVLAVAGDLSIRQGALETLTLDAEPAVLRKITTEVHGRRLVIGLVPGRVEIHQPIRI